MNTTNKFQFTNNGLRNNFEAENLHIQSHSEIIYSISEKVSGEWCDRKINLLAHHSPIYCSQLTKEYFFSISIAINQKKYM